MEQINIIKIWSDSINEKNLEKIIKNAKIWEEKTKEKFIFISSWAVKLWKDRVKEAWKNIENFSKSALASIWQKYLMRQYQEFLWKKELIWEILIDDFADEKHLAKTIENLLKNNVWIIINYNDTLHSDELNNVSEKSDNDKNTVFVTKVLKKYLDIDIKRVIYLTNTNGLLDKNKKTVLGWKICLEKDRDYFKSFVEKNKSDSWTGWMESKLNCGFEVLEYWVWETIIANARDWCECLEGNGKYTRFIY